MNLWPIKHIRIETNLKAEKIYEILDNSIDQDSQGIYWGKRFSKKFWGRISQKAFRIRPVVPYWNISPVDIKGRIIDVSQEKNGLDIQMTSPYLRIVIPLAILAVVLFFVNFGLKGELNVFYANSLITLAAAYLLVNIPFQIQSIWSIKNLNRNIGGRIYMLK
jgi:hypothetical protein